MDAPRPTPPSPLESALSRESDKQEWVDWLFSRVAPRYDLGNDVMSLGWHTKWKRRLVDYADPKPGMRILDVACGTGDVTWMLAERAGNGEVFGLDVNADMMRVATDKWRPVPGQVGFVRADAAAIPFPDAHFDLVTCSYSGRGFPDWPAVLRDVYRVLKPGASFWNLDFARPPQAWWDATYRGWMTVSGAVLGTVLHGDPRTYVYIPESMRHYRGQRWLRDEMTAIGFDAALIETTACLMAYNRGTRPP